MLLAYKTRTLELKLTEAKVTSEVEICVQYEDTKPEGFISPQEDLVFSNGVTPVTIVPAPSDNWVRRIAEILIFNADTVQHEVTVQLKDSGAIGIRRCIRSILLPGQTLEYTDDYGWSTPENYTIPILATYAKLVSPAFTGVPTAPTAARGTVTTQLATTEFVNKPYGLFQARLIAQQATFSSGNWSLMLYAQVDFDTEGAWNAATHLFICPKTGKWEVTGSALVGASGGFTANNNQNFGLFKNGIPGVGVPLVQSVMPTASTFGGISHQCPIVPTIVSLNQGDTVGSWGNFVGGGTMVAAGDPNNALTYTNIQWVSA